jgi:hypothetical protein
LQRTIAVDCSPLQFWGEILLRKWSEGPGGRPLGFLNRSDRIVMTCILMKQRRENGTHRSARACERGRNWPKVADFSPLRAFVHVLRRAFGRWIWRNARAQDSGSGSAGRLAPLVKRRVRDPTRHNCNGRFILNNDHVLIAIGFARLGVRLDWR